MSISSIAGSSAATTLQSNALGGTTTPVVDEANLPAAIRNGTAEEKKAYQGALSFESVLVGQMTKAMMATTGMPGTGGSSSSDDGQGGGDAATQMLKQTLPDTLATAIMNNGGLGLAQQLDTTFPTTTSLSSQAQTGAVSTADGSTTTSTAAAADGDQGGVTA